MPPRSALVVGLRGLMDTGETAMGWQGLGATRGLHLRRKSLRRVLWKNDKS